MTEQNLGNILVAERDWRMQEMEFCKKIPFLYTTQNFRQHIDQFWRLCVPIIYAHWEGFVVAAMKSVVDYVNDIQVPYYMAPKHMVLLDNKARFGYLQGNCTLEQQSRFLDEFLQAQANGIHINRALISANSKLNYVQLEKMLAYFGIELSPALVSNKQGIEKLVWYRNSIAHGENSIQVTQKEIEYFIDCIIKCVDEIIILLLRYITELNHMLHR
ncbi:MAE_28990/MAE_18760 family HEPN-like nuclease [Anaeroselena agilis]|uniref:MAE_28990/MAE_18760 family HEPN-like nuclease n=1 Tax=Anaeroselena agilis TaxID=3063788 RepID=A0ABU3P4K8_9FIRM|nr:MAE_28990/MAE_18760 family HEPN-like nuclease [Selenomonadales bacterium 4137-cl]